MNETAFLAEVGTLASRCGLLWAHFTAPFRGSPAHHGDYGFPDLVIAGLRGVIFAELKMGGGQLAPQQESWRDILQAGGATWRLWYPADLYTGAIAADFQRIR